MAESHEDLIAQFVSVTSASPQDAQHFLENSSWDLSSAVTEFYNPLEEEEDASTAAQPAPPVPPAAPQPIPTASSMPAPPSSSSQPKKKFATLGDLQGGSGSGGPSHDHSDDDDDDLNADPNLFAGGEKSGLAVQNPDDLKRKIIERAKRNAQRPGGDEPRPQRSRFTGAARTLGGDDTPSEMIPDPSAAQPQRPALVTRDLHFWADGFSVDDGPLYRFDDPNNTDILAQIKQGRAPMHILNVTQDQEVDVNVQQHNNEPYKPPKKKYKPFAGSGQRLGAPTPGEEDTSTAQATSSTSTAPASAAASASASTGQTASQPAVQVDDSQPTISLQMRLGDGTRLSSRFNTTHTVGDVYDFINSASTTSRDRDWVLMTTFPSKELTEKGQTLGDLPDFKRGGVVVQKWS